MMVFAAQLAEGGGPCQGSPHPFTLCNPSTRVMSTIYFIFCCLYPSPPPRHHGSVWVLPVISLLLANTVSPVRACLIIWWERFRGTQKADDRGPLSIPSSLCHPPPPPPQQDYRDVLVAAVPMPVLKSLLDYFYYRALCIPVRNNPATTVTSLPLS
jgi:hypothetical protein